MSAWIPGVYIHASNVTFTINNHDMLGTHLRALLWTILICAVVVGMVRERGRGRGEATARRRSRRNRTTSTRLLNDDMEVDLESGSSSAEHPRPEHTSPGFYQMGTATATRRNNRERKRRSRARRSQSSQPFNLDDTADEEEAPAPVWRTETMPGMPRRHDCGSRSLTCTHCGAKLWKGEKDRAMMCCRKGKTHETLKRIFPTKHEPLWDLFNYHLLPDEPQYQDIKQMATLLRKYARKIYNQFSMASATSYNQKVDGFSYIALHGALYHYAGPPASIGTPKFAQLYVIDQEYEALAKRMLALQVENNPLAWLYRRLLSDLQAAFNARNHLVLQYVQASEVPADEVYQCEIVFKATAT